MTPFLEKFANNARADLILELAAKQAEIDALMMEFCPERMKSEQMGKQIECGTVNDCLPNCAENNPYQRICKTVADEFGGMLCDESLTAYDANILQAKVTGAMQCYVRIGEWEMHQESVDVNVDLLAQSCETKRGLRIAKEALEMQVAEEKQIY